MSTYKKKNILIGALLAVVVVMGIAYAAFASNLSITGSGATTNNWGVKILSITPDKTAGGTSPSYTTTGSISQSVTSDLSATFQAALISPGDSVTYTIVVQNYGSIDAKLNTINMPLSSNPAISFSRDGIDEGNKINANSSEEFTVTVTYVDNENGQEQPAQITSNFTINLDFIQDDGTGTVVAHDVDGKALLTSKVGETCGDGQLVEDSLESGKYVYTGNNPCNYLSFAGNTWRIIGIDSQGIKIITDEKLDTEMAFDIVGARNKNTSTYCGDAAYNGCNAWAATSNLLENPAEFVLRSDRHGTVVDDSTLNKYLNGDYYTNVLEKNSNIIEGIFNVGPHDDESFYHWKGYVALLTASEYRAAGGYYSYLTKPYTWWLVSPWNSAGATISVTVVFNKGVYGNYCKTARNLVAVRPVIYLSSKIKMEGSGTDDENIYKIVE